MTLAAGANPPAPSFHRSPRLMLALLLSGAAACAGGSLQEEPAPAAKASMSKSAEGAGPVLTMQAIESAVGGGVIRAGQSMTGTFDARDSRLPDQSYFERWTLSATAGQRLIITMSSSDFDSYAIVARANGNDVEYLFQDDDSGGGSDAQIVFVVPATGDYMIIANSRKPEATGEYNLSVIST